MPLLDHFHPPLVDSRDWHSFHNAWAAQIAGDLNTQLPDEYFAESNVQFGIEIDVATFREGDDTTDAVGPAGWQPPAATLSVPFAVGTDVITVEVYRRLSGRILIGAIELVSPSNKDRPAHREAFVSKCETYLRQGIGVAVVDVVTNRGGNLHDDLLARVGGPGHESWGAELYAVAYRPTGTIKDGRLDVWREELAVGAPLPTVPLWLRFGSCLAVRLEDTYLATCRQSKIRLPSCNGSQTG